VPNAREQAAPNQFSNTVCDQFDRGFFVKTQIQIHNFCVSVVVVVVVVVVIKNRSQQDA
jgi:hypothetical protein